MTRPILAGADGSPQSDAAVLWAAEEAARRRAPLRLIHAWPWLNNARSDQPPHGDLQAAALHMLARIEDEVRRRHPALVVQSEAVGGDTVESLLAAAEDCELLVLGSRGLGGFAGLLVGSVGLATTARAQLPVVLVRAGGQDDAEHGDGPGTPEIVLGLDARSPADPVLDFAFNEARLSGAAIRAVHGWDIPQAWSYAGWAFAPVNATDLQLDTAEFQKDEAKLLTQALLDWREKYPDVEIIEDVRSGGAARALVDAAAHAQLVVVGRHVSPHKVGPHLGPVTHAVIHHAQAPTVVVPHE